MNRHLLNTLGALVLSLAAGSAFAQLDLHNVVTGSPIKLDEAKPEGRDTPAVKEFLQTGQNPYNENQQVLPRGKEIFATACAGCHGHLGEGKIGPALNNGRFHYPENESDKGLFSTIYGGADRQMGPQNEILTLDEMLAVMAWIRHMYTGTGDNAAWLTAEQKKSFKPYKE